MLWIYLDLLHLICYLKGLEELCLYYLIIAFLSFLHSCGSDTVSADLDDTLFYSCVENSISETFSLKTYRYFGGNPGDTAYIHCDSEFA